MGTWGPGNFDSDHAMTFLDDLLRSLSETIATNLNEPITHQPEYLGFVGDKIVMPAVDVMITICERYTTSPPRLEAETVINWKESYLSIFDTTIDQYGSKEKYKIRRREIIVETFDRLRDIIIETDSL